MAPRDDDAHALLNDCAAVYSALVQEQDLRSNQTVANYASADGQKKYVHMYFAKQVSLWRLVRQKIGDKGNVWSVGAGPMLDLFGWFWDRPAASPTRVVACDVLDWLHVRNLASWKALANTLIPSLEYRAGVGVPAPALLPQCGAITAASLPATDVEDGATVLFPFMLNHVVGQNSPAGELARAALKTWVDDILARGGRVVIADFHASKAPDFWQRVQTMLGTNAVPKDDITFRDRIGEVAALYRDPVSTRRGSNFMATATVLVIEGGNAFFL